MATLPSAGARSMVAEQEASVNCRASRCRSWTGRTRQNHDRGARRTPPVFDALRRTLQCVRICLAVLAGFSRRTGTRPRRARFGAGCVNCSATRMWSRRWASSGSFPSLSSRTCRLRHCGRNCRAPVLGSPRVLDGDGRPACFKPRRSPLSFRSPTPFHLPMLDHGRIREDLNTAGYGAWARLRSLRARFWPGRR